jgi:hypothetical protein
MSTSIYFFCWTIFMELFCVVYIDMKVVISHISIITIGGVFRRLAKHWYTLPIFSETKLTLHIYAGLKYPFNYYHED